MIWGGPGREFALRFFFPRQLAVELFFFQVVESSFFFPARVAVEFFFPLLPGPPQIINGSFLRLPSLLVVGKQTVIG